MSSMDTDGNPLMLRLPRELMKRLDRQVALIREQSLLVTRDDVVTLLLRAALDDTEGKPRPGVHKPALRRISSPINQLLKALVTEREVADLETRLSLRARREADSPLLIESVPSLRALDLDVQHRGGPVPLPEAAFVRHVVVDRARAYFFVACADRACSGGHDGTAPLTSALQAGESTIALEHSCDGVTAGSPCGRVLEIVATAVYG